MTDFLTRKQNSWNIRLAKALGICVLIVLIVSVSEKFVMAHHANSSVLNSINRALFQDSNSSLSEEPAASTELPPDFAEEIFKPPGSNDARVSGQGGVVGFFSPHEPDQSFQDYAHILVEKGWIKVESGHPCAASFIKEEGSYTWLFLSCMLVQNETAVVVQCG